MEIKVRIFNIGYDTDGDYQLADELPQELTATLDVSDVNNKIEVDDAVCDYVSDETGFCIEYCQYEILK